MKKKIEQENYLISKSTEVLQPVFHMYYSTVVWEGDTIIYVKAPCYKILDDSCLPRGASYDGRRTAVIRKIGTKIKVPILVCRQEEIYAIPTMSPKNYNCIWIFYHHVDDIAIDKNRPGKCIVIFKSGNQLPLDVSYYVMSKQLGRTARCITVFSSM
ncbi:competence protein ComK [Evansella tamaricis]|uniref:Competence protein ComK n=1 Tax=Evansella tamaricis TaxID=2069301 RepID=A0ABS6JEQ5_9BACI|nr:competence protein ComK [Evansella tamaricis]MBU9711684.1 competence protein ComK [Evansella tamaricis]